MEEELIEVARLSLAQRVDQLGLYAEEGQAELKNGLIAIAKICENTPEADPVATITTLLENINLNRINIVNAVTEQKNKSLYIKLINKDKDKDKDSATALTALNRIAPEDNLEARTIFMQNLKRVLAREVVH